MSGEERRVLVIGASSGIGAAVARRFAMANCTVAVADLSEVVWPDDVPQGARFTVDVSDERSVCDAVQHAATALGGLDVVVNCAGILGPVEASIHVEAETFDRISRVNLFGAFLVSREAIPHLLESKRGRLIHVASIAGKEGNPQMAAYSASKAGVIGLVKALGKEFAATNLTVNAIAPASIETPLIAAMTAERRELQKSLIPMQRFGHAGEAAALIDFIASEDASFTTGFVYDLSGGRADY